MKLWPMLLVLLGSQAMAQALQDPTRPPAELAALTAPGSEGATSAAPAEPRGPRLESVLVGRGYAGREVAVIDGKIVRRGETFNGAVLVRVAPNEAVLRRNGKDEVLRVFPAIIEGKASASAARK